MLMTTDPGDLVLDPTCGSGTTAYVAEQWGRRWITIDTSRVAIALARHAADGGALPVLPAGGFLRREEERTRTQSPRLLAMTRRNLKSDNGQVNGGDIKRGFVYKRVPHVTLKSIANNEEIDAIHEKYQPRLEELRGKDQRGGR